MAFSGRTGNAPLSFRTIRVHNHPMRELSPSALFVFLILIGTAASADALRPVTVEDEMRLRSIVDVKIAPDGRRVAYVVSTPSLEKNEHLPELFVVATGGGKAVRLAEGLRILNTPLPAPRLRWSPDGNMVSLLAMTGDRPQVFGIPVSGQTPRQLTHAPEGVFGFEWSPDGSRIAYLTRDPIPEEEARRRRDVIHADAPAKPTRLAVTRLDDPAARILSSPSHYVDSYAWTPDGREIVYSAAPRSGFTAQYETRLFAIPAGGGDARLLVDRPGMNVRPHVSPDGKWIAFVTTHGRADIMVPRSLAVVSAAGGDIRLFLMDDAWINEIVWARDSRSLYCIANDGTFASKERMFEQPIVRLWIENGRAETVIASGTVNYSMTLSADGRHLAFRSVQGRSMGDVFVLDTASGKTRGLTDANPELHELALGELRPVQWRSFDEMEIWGLLLTPHGWKEGERLPLLVYVHGGPGGGVTYGHFPQFMHAISQVDPYPTEAMASAGFAVLFPMPRGGAGYGEKGQRAVIDAWGEGDYHDIMAGVDEMIRRGIADPDRLGVMGASYGGYMTNWIVTRTGRFRAASAAASISDLTDIRLIPDGGEITAHYFREPWENRESYIAHSPLTFVERVTTPLLLQHGERDPRVPVAGAWKFYRALKTLGRTVEMDIYPRGGHVLYEPVLQRDVMQRNLEWFQRWILRDGESGEPAEDAQDPL
ncbi:MAG TPA: S9 family peptidase [Thermoanaerobaculia bacterium]|nr:S9 family peptidase [Thermoanaerobaculia bacterium]